MTKTKWNTDRLFEKRSERFLEDQTSVYEDLDIISVIKSVDVQKFGVDYLGEKDGKLSRIDFKAIAEFIPTFAFEVEGNIRTRQTGWMFQDNQTTHIAVIYFNFINNQGYYKNKQQLINHETVDRVKVLLIDKVKLQAQIQTWLEEHSKYKTVNELCNYLRTLDTDDTQGYSFDENGEVTHRQGWEKPYSFVVSGKKIYERPINCVIRREFLENFADKVLEYTY